MYHLARLQAQAVYPFNASSFKTEAERVADTASTSARDENAELKAEWADLIASIYNNLAGTYVECLGLDRIYPDARSCFWFQLSFWPIRMACGRKTMNVRPNTAPMFS